MLIMKKVLLLCLFLVSTGCFNSVEKEKVVAKVGSRVYSVDDINSRIDNLDPQLKEFFDKKENKVRMLDQIIQEEVVYQLAIKERLQRKKDFKETLEELKRQALINYFIKQNVDNRAEVTRAEVEDFYNDNSAQFAAYESRNLSHILVKSNDEAKNIAKRLRQGARFEELAAQYSIDPSNKQGGQLGWVRKEALVPEFANVAYSLTKNAPISGVVKSQFGYHIIRFNDARVVPQQSLDAVYVQISDNLLAQKKRDIFNQIIENGKESVKIERSIENL
jgi:peptidyl-prolyl cis-trans isomerase C